MKMSKRNVTRLALCHSCLTKLFFSQILLLPMYTTTFLVIILASHVISHASVLQLRTSVKNSVNVVWTVSWVKKYFFVSFFVRTFFVLSPKILSWSHEVVTSLLSIVKKNKKIVILCLAAVASWLKLVSEERLLYSGCRGKGGEQVALNFCIHAISSP